ncbi:MAG: cysteine permease [Sulfurospirillaceae bacterium]|nr:cysteine permease [Sulfurospirillaceae bacterium]MDD2825318.1 cysteine permease [Sulfurospirillaceae bacterium]
MHMTILTHNEWLDSYILNKEFSLKAGISSNAYRYWKDGEAAKFDDARVVFLKKENILPKYQAIAQTCTNLAGMVQSQAFCKYTGLASSHLTQTNNSCVYHMLDIIEVCDVKFVNLKKFYDDLQLDYHYHIYIEKCKYFGPSPLEKKIKLSNGICVGYY